jgi:hypothetical protein
MTEGKRLRERLTFANVMATVAVFFALGGASYAATQLPKNSVGTKQLKKNAVTGAKIKKQTITAGKIKKGTLTGTQINLTTLGTVPTAQTANSLGPSENWHDAVLENGWNNAPPEAPFVSAGYYKDLAGVVHLRGVVSGGTLGKAIFHLPPGYRPTNGKVITPLALCGGCPTGPSAPVLIAGSNVSGGAQDGALLPIVGTTLGLDGISFKAES